MSNKDDSAKSIIEGEILNHRISLILAIIVLANPNKH